MSNIWANTPLLSKNNAKGWLYFGAEYCNFDTKWFESKISPLYRNVFREDKEKNYYQNVWKQQLNMELVE